MSRNEDELDEVDREIIRLFHQYHDEYMVHPREDEFSAFTLYILYSMLGSEIDNFVTADNEADENIALDQLRTNAALILHKVRNFLADDKIYYGGVSAVENLARYYVEVVGLELITTDDLQTFDYRLISWAATDAQKRSADTASAEQLNTTLTLTVLEGVLDEYLSQLPATVRAPVQRTESAPPRARPGAFGHWDPNADYAREAREARLSREAQEQRHTPSPPPRSPSV